MGGERALACRRAEKTRVRCDPLHAPPRILGHALATVSRCGLEILGAHAPEMSSTSTMSIPSLFTRSAPRRSGRAIARPPARRRAEQEGNRRGDLRRQPRRAKSSSRITEAARDSSPTKVPRECHGQRMSARRRAGSRIASVLRLRSRRLRTRRGLGVSDRPHPHALHPVRPRRSAASPAVAPDRARELDQVRLDEQSQRVVAIRSGKNRRLSIASRISSVVDSTPGTRTAVQIAAQYKAQPEVVFLQEPACGSESRSRSRRPPAPPLPAHGRPDRNRYQRESARRLRQSTKRRAARPTTRSAATTRPSASATGPSPARISRMSALLAVSETVRLHLSV